jgi:aryl-alcohol dehydrogenase-like predicted oxidoreductase
MDSRDWRRWHIDFTHFAPPALQANLALRDRLRPIAARHDATVAAVAVAWVLSWPGVTGAIVGPRSPDQVDGWIGAADFALTDDDLDEIEVALVDLGVGAGPTRPPKAS